MKTKLDRNLFSSLIPDNSTAVPIDNEWVLTFSELVSAGLGNIVINNSGDGNVFLQIDVNLNFNTVDDFNTVDTIAPTLISSTPADDTTAVLVGSNVALTFDEAVVAGTGNIVISDGSDTRIIPVNDGQVSIIDNIATINPTFDLNSDTTYNVQLASGVINDVEGNAYAGINDTSRLNFATTDTIVPIAPTLALAADTGSDPNDNITSDPTVNVSGLESGATWEYSTDRGGNLTTGNAGNSFELSDGTYPAGQILVRQFDEAGNVISNGSFASTVVVDPGADADTSIVVFDLVGGVSSDHSDRVFQPDTDYTIYIKVDSDGDGDFGLLNTSPTGDRGTWGAWSGSQNLSAEDRVVLVGDDTEIGVRGPDLFAVSRVEAGGAGTTWGSRGANVPQTVVIMHRDGVLSHAGVRTGTTTFGGARGVGSARTRLFGSDMATHPTPQPLPITRHLSTAYQRTMADGILVTQGLL